MHCSKEYKEHEIKKKQIENRQKIVHNLAAMTCPKRISF